jgi:(4-alkanoyl-5-oxo-2,5-dihydrofuran-3-yl)methyl phosphate reductase
MILVTGATGNIGSEVLAQLVQAGHAVRVLARDPAKLEKYAGKIEVVKGDLSKPETLDAAFTGVDKAFLLFNAGDLPTLAGNATDAAKKAGVKHIVMLSSASVVDEKPTQIGRWHIAGEAKVKASGIPWTMIQPGAFASNTFQWADSIKKNGAVFLPMGEGKLTPIDPHDIADVAVKVLTEPGHEGKSYELSGPEALTTDEQLAKISAAIGKPLKYVNVTPEAAREGMAKAGMPEVFINAMLEISERVREGHGWEPNKTVEELLGRKARPYEVWLERNVDAFK